MIYGYPSKELNEYGLVELKEVTFSASPKVLRQIGEFILDMANLMEKGEFTTSHYHIETFVQGWNKRFPNKDVIVTRPESEDNGQQQ